MPVLSPPIPVERPTPGQGGGGLPPPAHGGGGDNSPGDGSFDYSRRLYRARLGLLVALTSIGVLFVTITVAFLLLRHGSMLLDPRTGSYVRYWVPMVLPVRLLLLNTVVLVASSCTLELARRSLAREMVLAPVRSIPGISVDKELEVPWLAITIVLGALFLGGQWAAWSALARHGFHIFSGIPSPFFYILTGAHAVHLCGGLVVLLYSGLTSLFRPGLEHRRIVIEMAAWYWHFMTALWIYIFTLFEIGRLGG